MPSSAAPQKKLNTKIEPLHARDHPYAMVRLLLVEDNPRYAKRVKDALRLSHFSAQMVLAYSAEQAIKYVRSLTFDLVIFNFRLAFPDGLANLHKYVTEREVPPIVVYNGSGLHWEREFASIFGAKEYIEGSSSMKEFVGTIREVINKGRPPMILSGT